MALLKAIYEAKDDIPDGYGELYEERDAKWELTQVEGFKTDADVARVQEALRKEKNDHKGVKEKLSLWGELEPDETRTQLDRIPELEAHQGDNKPDEAKMGELVDARVRTQMAPIERKVVALEKTNGELTTANDTYASNDRRRLIHDEIRSAGVASKILDTAMDDALLLGERVFEIREDDDAIVTKDGVGVTPGIRAADWLAEVQTSRAHWWLPSQGGGAGGGGGGGGAFGNNPWSKEHWNVTNQGKMVREKGLETAERMAKQAGSFIGATSAKKESA